MLASAPIFPLPSAKKTSLEAFLGCLPNQGAAEVGSLLTSGTRTTALLGLGERLF